MTEIRINDGLQTFSLNGKCEITYNPTDVFFLERIYAVFEELDAKQDEYRKQREALKSPAEVFAYARQQDKQMREVLNELLGIDVCTPLFGYTNIYAMDGDGLPLWAAVLFAIFDTMDASIINEQKKTNPRIEKYTKKYHR